MIYLRWRSGDPRRGRVFPPLPPDHPSVSHPCPGCDQPCGSSVPVQLAAVGPVDEAARERHAAGRWYAAGAVLLHKGCADALTDDGLEHLVAELVVVGHDVG